MTYSISDHGHGRFFTVYILFDDGDSLDKNFPSFDSAFDYIVDLRNFIENQKKKGGRDSET